MSLEIAYLAPGRHSKADAEDEAKAAKNYYFPGVFLSSTVSRFVRPVQNLRMGAVEWIGPLEQITLSIACLEEDIRSDTTHQELDPTKMLSIIASTVPFADYNQSPRNMYQCQMAKQTMGTPYHNHPFRMDNKVYRLLFPQNPIVRTETYNEYDFDQCPSGVNAVVAVIAYTGYDMEDAMIINKGAYDRGFGHGCVYKSYVKEVNSDTAETSGTSATKSRYRMINPTDKRAAEEIAEKGLDADGLPFIGQKVTHGDPELAVFDKTLNKTKLTSFKDHEAARVENVRLMGNERDPTSASLGYTLRIGRNPVIGDKFSSRHG